MLQASLTLLSSTSPISGSQGQLAVSREDLASVVLQALLHPPESGRVIQVSLQHCCMVQEVERQGLLIKPLIAGATKYVRCVRWYVLMHCVLTSVVYQNMLMQVVARPGSGANDWSAMFAGLPDQAPSSL